MYNNIYKAKSENGWETGFLLPQFSALFPVMLKTNNKIVCEKSISDYVLVDLNTACRFSGAYDNNGNPLFTEDLVKINNAFAIIKFGKHKDCHGIEMYGYYISWVNSKSHPEAKLYRNDFCYWTTYDKKLEFIGSTIENNAQELISKHETNC